MKNSNRPVGKQGLSIDCLYVLLALMTCVNPAVAQSVNVDSRLLNGEFTNIKSPVFTPDGQHVLYLGREPGSDSTQLYRQSVSGGEPRVLNPSLVAGGDVLEFKLTPNGQQVIYRADQLVDERDELFRVSIFGGSATPLDPNFRNNRDVSNFNISPDGQTVAYSLSSDSLFSVGLTNGVISNLGAKLPSGFIPRNFNDDGYQIDANSDRVVFTTTNSNSSSRRNGVFSVTLDGKSVTQVSLPIPRSLSIDRSFLITSDGLHVIYANTDSSTVGAGPIQLFRASIDGSQSVVELTDQVNIADDFSDLTLTPDDDFIIAVSRFMSANGASEVLRIPVFSDQAIRPISQTFDAGFRGARFPIVSPDGRFVVYAADDETRFQDNVFQVPIEGGTPLKLTQTSPNSERILGFSMAITPDSQQVVYVEETEGTIDTDNEFFFQLFSTPIEGGEQLVLSERLIDLDDEQLIFTVSPDARQLVYRSLDLNSLFITSLNSQDGFCFVVPTEQQRYATICL